MLDLFLLLCYNYNVRKKRVIQKNKKYLKKVLTTTLKSGILIM